MVSHDAHGVTFEDSQVETIGQFRRHTDNDAIAVLGTDVDGQLARDDFALRLVQHAMQHPL